MKKEKKKNKQIFLTGKIKKVHDPNSACFTSSRHDKEILIEPFKWQNKE